MCGIAGIFRSEPGRPVEEGLLRRMTDALVHRGPDGSGHRATNGYGLGHRRLSILDLQDGAQPMGEGHLWVTFNGEIYNFLELRAELESLGCRFQTRCDTEVLLHGYRVWGEELPSKLRGMFAFVIVDERDHSLFGARDRLGKKPFYWTELASGSTAGPDFAFASELKALRVIPGVSGDLDPRALGEFLCLRYVPDPRTILSSVHKLPPAHQITIRDGRRTIRRYWAPSFAEQDSGSVEDFCGRILETLDEAVKLRLMADVPLGAFLSGGIDSYAVVDSMARVGSGSVVACTMGFEGGGKLDEREHARAAARATGATLHEGVLTPDDMLNQEWFSDTFDEPFADDSAIPTYHVSKIAREHVTVALSGDGGDETFAGYRRHKFDALENQTRRILPSAVWSALGAIYPKFDFLPRAMRFKRTFQNLARTPGDAYARSVSALLPEQIAPLLRSEWRAASEDPFQVVRDAYERCESDHPLARCAAADFHSYLPGQILVKVDRASMAVSLEVRAPMLDHHFVELACRVPSQLKLLDGQTKGLLRRAFRARLGQAALERPKQGFSPPSKDWLRGPIGDALNDAFDDEQLSSILDTEKLRKALQQHRSGLHEHTSLLWAVSVFHRYLRRWA
ncbi:MAG: asparagine synthase (glutamine-hydrolyzing) [Planctomycetota bacterium]